MTEDSTARLAREALAMLKNYEEHFLYTDDLWQVTITLN